MRLDERPSGDAEDFRFAQLDRALGHLNDYLTAVMSVRRDPEINVVGRRDLPALAFGFGWDLHADGDRSEVEWQGYMLHDRHGLADEPLGRAEADLAMWISVSRDHPMKVAGDFVLTANAALARERFSHAVADAGTAIELLVSAALRMAAPRRGYHAAKLANVLDGAFANRVKDHFAPMFGYGQDPKNDLDPLGEWWRETYLLRNRVVHAGYQPSEVETERALLAAEALQQDLGARIANAPDLQSLLFAIPEEVIDAAAAERDRRLARDE